MSVEKEISSLEDQLESILETIKLISEECDRIGDESEESKNRLTEVLFEEMRDFELVQATLKKKKVENLKTMGFYEFNLALIHMLVILCTKFITIFLKAKVN